jgi:hypothetical protein
VIIPQPVTGQSKTIWRGGGGKLISVYSTWFSFFKKNMSSLQQFYSSKEFQSQKSLSNIAKSQFKMEDILKLMVQKLNKMKARI